MNINMTVKELRFNLPLETVRRLYALLSSEKFLSYKASCSAVC